MTTHAPLRSRRTKAKSVYHVQGLGDGDFPTSPLKDTRLLGVGSSAWLDGLLQRRCFTTIRHGTTSPHGRKPRCGSKPHVRSLERTALPHSALAPASGLSTKARTSRPHISCQCAQRIPAKLIKLPCLGLRPRMAGISFSIRSLAGGWVSSWRTTSDS